MEKIIILRKVREEGKFLDYMRWISNEDPLFDFDGLDSIRQEPYANDNLSVRPYDS